MPKLYDYSSYTKEELKQLLDDAMNRSQFPANVDPWAEYDKGEALKDEWNSRVSEKEKVSPWEINHNVVEQYNLWKRLPGWEKIPGVEVNTNPEIIEPTAVGYVQGKNPNVVNIHTSRSPDPVDTLAHELAHTRQLKYGFKEGTGTEKDKLYQELLSRMKENSTIMKSSNFADNPLEVFANVESEMVKGLNEGIPFQDTELGKKIGASKGSPVLKYIRERTLMGQPTIYEDQGPTWQDKMQNLLDKYRRKLGR